MSQEYRGLLAFVFPRHIEHPDSTGRLELLGALGPVTPEGKLFGGFLGRHEVQDLEISGMILQQVTDTARKLIGPGKSAVVAEAVKKSFADECISRHQLEDILKAVPILDSGCLDFRRLQKLVLNLHQARISEICDQLSSKSLNQGVIENHATYRHLPTTEYKRKQKKTRMTDSLLQDLHQGVFSITQIDEPATTESLRSNIKLIRPLGPLRDKWDRSCSTRGQGQASYVGRNSSIDENSA